MKLIGIVTIACILTVLISMQVRSTEETNEVVSTSGISFNENKAWEAIKQQAKEENKVIFIDVYASWCGPCKLLKKNTFSDQTVGDFFNKEFINAAYDAEVGAGLEVAQIFNVSAYPTLIFVSPDGTLVKKAVGYHSSDELLKLAKEVLAKNKKK